MKTTAMTMMTEAGAVGKVEGAQMMMRTSATVKDAAVGKAEDPKIETNAVVRSGKAVME